MKPSDPSFALMFATEGNQWLYQVPRFQREYVWGKYNWSKILEDICENDQGLYMGAIICVTQEVEPNPGDEMTYEIVDGQQRLITLSIMLAAIYKKLKHFENSKEIESDKDEYIVAINGIAKRLLRKVTSGNIDPSIAKIHNRGLIYALRVQPSTQDNNLEDYKYILNDIGLLTEVNQPKYCGNRKLYKCLRFFLDNIESDYGKLMDLLNRIYKLQFTHISEKSQSKAFLLFETLNYRGVPLSAIDIIKNKMLATLESKHNVSIEESYSQWQTLLDYLPEKNVQDRFLRQFYNAFKHKPQVGISNISRATASNIIAIYENHIKRNAKDILDQLLEKAKKYNEIIEPEKLEDSKLVAKLIDLGRIGAATSYTFLMYLFSLPKSSFSEEGWSVKVVDLLCKYYFRRNITDTPATRDLDTLNMELIESCEKKLKNEDDNKLDFNFIKNSLLNARFKPSNDEIFEKGLSDNLYYNNSGMARYALARLDEASHSREYAPDLWKRSDKGILIWTVEHVFPQGKKITDEWIDMIGNGDKEKAKEIHDSMVDCLGNLTLSAYNSSLSNLPFEKKQVKMEEGVLGSKIYIGYKNGLSLNNIKFTVNGYDTCLAETKTWKSEHIESRNNMMVKALLKIFNFDNKD